MPRSPRKHAPKLDRVRALAISDMVELVRAGLATATAERVVAGGREHEVARGADHRSGAARTRRREAMSRKHESPVRRRR